MSEQLWTDERIIAVSEGLGAHFDRDSGDRLLWNQMARMIEKDMRAIRDDLQQRIEELEAENARLRALLPSEVSQRAIRLLANGLRPKDMDVHGPDILAWLDQLESEETDD